MGKSNKKVKNDRINTLRKQYDAYLEEDKKRKERNEYILGKLDKMRSSTALVPISSKASYHYEDSSDVYMRPGNVRKTAPINDNYVSHLEAPNVTSDILNKHLDESTILKEISKRYILIPKRRMPIDKVEYAYSKDAINDNDWRSKYNILDNLKQQEKEGRSDTPTNLHNEIINRSYKDPEVIYDNQSRIFDNSRNQILPEVNANKLNTYPENKTNKSVDFEIPENSCIDDNKKMPLQASSISPNKDLTIDDTKPLHNSDLTNTTVTSEIHEPHQEYIEEKEKYYSDINEKQVNYEQNQNIDNDMHITEGYNNSQNYPEGIQLENDNQTLPDYNEHKGYENVNDISYSEELSTEVQLQEPSVVAITDENQLINPIENTENEKDIRNAQDLPCPEPVKLNADTDKSYGGQMEADQITYDPPQDLETTQENNPVMLENTEHVDHDSEINAFEAEQKEMFYSEQTDDAYAYNQGDSNTGEYPAEGYEQNDQYAYFEGAQQEQGYATNVNEHEEATERYDPHYNQQYEGTYENQQPDHVTNYEHTNAYEQQPYQEGNYENQQFENVVNYENQHENPNVYQPENVSNENELQENVLVPQDNEVYDQHLYAEQSETQDNIEQQLTAEEGYIENPPITDELQPEPEGEIERVMDITNRVEQMPEPKFS
ncbi:uncharacterized protein [Epargyreus clarus]|uniref:uncharacterized protein isoform X2 n=1 Tax=Epargyreus clarus TaxID=520877 RepID=UPI003C2CA622